MNIFATSHCPEQSARHLDTKRVNKMILESAQMLCTALYEHKPNRFTKCQYSVYPKKVHKKSSKPITKHVYYIGNTRMCAPTHKNHPSNIWTRSTRANYEWLLAHFRALAEEYYTRRGHWHKSFRELFKTLSECVSWIPEGNLTSFANCAANESVGVNYKHIEDVHLAYQKYLSDRWSMDKIEPVWT